MIMLPWRRARFRIRGREPAFIRHVFCPGKQPVQPLPAGKQAADRPATKINHARTRPKDCHCLLQLFEVSPSECWRRGETDVPTEIDCVLDDDWSNTSWNKG